MSLPANMDDAKKTMELLKPLVEVYEYVKKFHDHDLDYRNSTARWANAILKEKEEHQRTKDKLLEVERKYSNLLEEYKKTLENVWTGKSVEKDKP
jgi:hypothetical protein